TSEHFSDQELSKIFSDRRSAISKVRDLIDIEDVLWQKARHYYDSRNKLIHERATILITDREVEDYRSVVETILAKLFGLNFSGR
ncbi:MAG: hypothetical protein KKB02_01875, partial [Alphaproteobacteria bacterium]|nr:hypothetical protein [Alphaproteobacteria bacterium]